LVCGLLTLRAGLPERRGSDRKAGLNELDAKEHEWQETMVVGVAAVGGGMGGLPGGWRGGAGGRARIRIVV